jgi:hypothetical protein
VPAMTSDSASAATGDGGCRPAEVASIHVPA